MDIEIHRADINDEVIYVWDCPLCSHPNEQSDNPNYEEEVCCTGCGISFELEG